MKRDQGIDKLGKLFRTADLVTLDTKLLLFKSWGHIDTTQLGVGFARVYASA